MKVVWLSNSRTDVRHITSALISRQIGISLQNNAREKHPDVIRPFPILFAPYAPSYHRITDHLGLRKQLRSKVLVKARLP
jgi:hypothetical protein